MSIEEMTTSSSGLSRPSVATAFRRQDALPPSSKAYAGNLGYGPNPKLVERIGSADLILVVGARLGEATTDGYSLVTPDHPDQILVHVHPDPDELNRVYRADLAICAEPDEFADDASTDSDLRSAHVVPPASAPAPSDSAIRAGTRVRAVVAATSQA